MKLSNCQIVKLSNCQIEYCHVYKQKRLNFTKFFKVSNSEFKILKNDFIFFFLSKSREKSIVFFIEIHEIFINI